MKILDDWTRKVVRAIGTGFKLSFLETTYLHRTLGFVNVSFSFLIS